MEQSEGLSEIATCEAADVAICADTAPWPMPARVSPMGSGDPAVLGSLVALERV